LGRGFHPAGDKRWGALLQKKKMRGRDKKAAMGNGTVEKREEHWITDERGKGLNDWRTGEDRILGEQMQLTYP